MIRNVHNKTKKNQLITLSDGRKIEGLVTIFLKDSQGQIYDMKSSKKITLINLSENDSRKSTPEKADVSWSLEVSGAKNQVYSVYNPRFIFQYSRYGPGGDRYYTVKTIQFYLSKKDKSRNLGNLPNMSEIVFKKSTGHGYTNEIVVKTHSDEISGGIIVTDTKKDGYSWILITDLIDRNISLAYHNHDDAVLTLRKMTNK